MQVSFYISAVETFKKIRKFLYIFKEKLDQQVGNVLAFE